MNIWQRLLDLFLSCSLRAVSDYYLEAEILWKETRWQCHRCGKVDFILIEEATDFWQEWQKRKSESSC